MVKSKASPLKSGSAAAVIQMPGWTGVNTQVVFVTLSGASVKKPPGSFRLFVLIVLVFSLSYTAY